ncbi:37383_t:CDS:2 [Gigaspora margarita]|uniref:37383_t:CDS:1 n=1 Tax=Gigaspora margarita TaxID=4874 RepID=A0ABN7UI47_GIGMA|nr:37383_t:CDS:2 [Gigaspora margarita]
MSYLEYDFKESTLIASGSFGTVYRAYSPKLGCVVALKKFSSKENEVYKEMTSQEHDNIIQFFGVTQDPGTKEYGLVLHFANNGHLRDYLKKYSDSLRWLDKLRMAKDIASGINYLHRKKILDIQLYPKQIARGLNSLLCYSCSFEDRTYFTVRFFWGLVQDEYFAAFVCQSVQTFYQGLKELSQEEGSVRFEGSRKEFVAANKVVKVAWFLVAAALEIAIIGANFYFLNAISVVLNCFSAIITFIAIAIRRENVAAFAVEGSFIALKLLFMNVIPLIIIFAVGNVAFAFYIFKWNLQKFLLLLLIGFIKN